MASQREGGVRPPELPKSHGKSVANNEHLESPTERLARFQSMERIAGQMTDFGPNLGIEVTMGKSLEKRPGAERGEDAFLVDKETGLTGVFDGLGGEGSGADASVKAATMAPQIYRAILGKIEGDLGQSLIEIADDQAKLEHPSQRETVARDFLKEWRGHDPAVQREIIALYRTFLKLSEAVRETGGKTTATLGKTVELPDGRRFEVVANVGDSGATLFGADGLMEEITEEDSALDYMLAAGVLTPEQARDPEHKVGKMTVRELKRTMYQALGKKPDPEEPLVPRLAVRELHPGDSVLYSTDGIRDVIADEDGEFDAVRAHKSVEEGGLGQLVDEAMRGAKKDECTALRKEIYAAAEEDDGLVEINAEDVVEDAA